MAMPTVITRYFVFYQGGADQTIRRDVFCDLAEKWGALGVKRVRLFFAGPERIYIAVSARSWPPQPVGLFERDGVHVQELPTFPHPQKRFKGSWKVFTIADVLRHFAETTWPAKQEQYA